MQEVYYNEMTLKISRISGIAFFQGSAIDANVAKINIGFEDLSWVWYILSNSDLSYYNCRGQFDKWFSFYTL